MRARTLRWLRLAVVAAATLAAGPGWLRAVGYVPPAVPVSNDTLRLKAAALATGAPRSTNTRGAVVPGYLSLRGLPPVEGRFTVTDTGLVFQAAMGSAMTFPLVGPLRESAGRRWRASTVSLAYVDDENGRPIHVFRIDAGVFETEVPDPLLEVAAHPPWLDSLGGRQGTVEQPLVDAADSVAVWRTARGIAASSYADTLYALFGQPRAAVGLIGNRGRTAGRLGEYIASRDSLALDPGRMMGEAQLRHALAHELGHRWQARAPSQVTTLWWGVRAIRDPRRYGYGDLAEHQAEAIAFAINFLQTTAGTTDHPASSITLLDHYELLVPGTRTMVRYLSMQPIYRNHPLRSVLTRGRV